MIWTSKNFHFFRLQILPRSLKFYVLYFSDDVHKFQEKNIQLKRRELEEILSSNHDAEEFCKESSSVLRDIGVIDEKQICVYVSKQSSF